MYFGKSPSTEALDKLLEATSKEIVNNSKHADNYKSDLSKGKNRFERRVYSSVANSVKEFNAIDMNKLFKDNILDVNIKVQGETDLYTVRIAFTSFLDYLHSNLKKKGVFDTGCILKALREAFNNGDTYVHCNCPDFRFRQDWWAHVKDIASNENEDDPLERAPDITNPDNTKGDGCKHVLLVLNNTSWLIKIASVIYNYINYMKKHYQKLYADIIYPAIYEGKFEEPIQLDMEDNLDAVVSIYNGKDLLYHGVESKDPYKDLEWEKDNVTGNIIAKTIINGKNVTLIKRENQLQSGSDTIDISNKWASTKNRFKKGNKSGFRFTSNDEDRPIKGQQSFNFNSLMSDNEK